MFLAEYFMSDSRLEHLCEVKRLIFQPVSIASVHFPYTAFRPIGPSLCYPNNVTHGYVRQTVMWIREQARYTRRGRNTITP